MVQVPFKLINEKNMQKTDLFKIDKPYYSAKQKPDIRNFDALNYITIDGQGEPAGKKFNQAVSALYPLAYGIKKIYKLEQMDFTVAKLEGLWWVDSDRKATDVDKSLWHWKLMIRLPDFVTNNQFKIAKEAVIAKKKDKNINKILFEDLNEGSCVQIMHKGPYKTEADSINKIFQYIEDHNLIVNGLHHEIYLTDPRKTAAEKMKTILRQPVRAK